MRSPIIKKITMKQAGRIIETRNPLGLFYALEAGVAIAKYNSTGDAWKEEFPN